MISLRVCASWYYYTWKSNKFGRCRSTFLQASSNNLRRWHATRGEMRFIKSTTSTRYYNWNSIFRSSAWFFAELSTILASQASSTWTRFTVKIFGESIIRESHVAFDLHAWKFLLDDCWSRVIRSGRGRNNCTLTNKLEDICCSDIIKIRVEEQRGCASYLWKKYINCFLQGK